MPRIQKQVSGIGQQDQTRWRRGYCTEVDKQIGGSLGHRPKGYVGIHEFGNLEAIGFLP